MAEIVLETERLVLRPWKNEDRAPFAAMNADPEVMRYFLSTLGSSESDALVDRIRDHFVSRGFGLFALERKSDGAFLGFTGLSRGPDNTPVAEETEIGWRLARKFWRQGLAYEAASACIDWAWRSTDLSRIVSFTSGENEPSRCLMQKLGLTRRPELDFDSPSIPSDNPLCRQVVYAIERADARGQAERG
ncbi:GNAT family N-acetyltransferase [Parerythrobacter aestuarii]|uniref:GNAT family N-acetyltransferase n=1 Tax=Parerythrobacter aestuarii TaxID=3020909 RepID=UPI0024DE9D32|nr:GNAT family N-acetyltransferase [Parerythrobacter aestuarii]